MICYKIILALPTSLEMSLKLTQLITHHTPSDLQPCTTEINLSLIYVCWDTNSGKTKRENAFIRKYSFTPFSRIFSHSLNRERGTYCQWILQSWFALLRYTIFLAGQLILSQSTHGYCQVRQNCGVAFGSLSSDQCTAFFLSPPFSSDQLHFGQRRDPTVGEQDQLHRGRLPVVAAVRRGELPGRDRRPAEHLHRVPNGQLRGGDVPPVCALGVLRQAEEQRWEHGQEDSTNVPRWVRSFFAFWNSLSKGVSHEQEKLHC